MSKRNKKLLSLLLSTMMVFSVVPSTVYAAPEQGTEATVEQDANEEVKQEDTVNNEADASADQTDTKQDETKADDTSQKNDEAVTQTGDEATPAVDNAVTVSGTSIQIPTIQFKGANAAVAEALTKDVEIDESNPAIKGLRKELENLEIAGGEAGEEDNVSAIATYADDTKVKKLTPDQIDTVVKMYGQYLEQWKENANILGVQNPFFLDFNDSDNSDRLGVLGEMLAMDNKSVADVRAGKVSYDDLTGMILTFTQGDKLGILHYGTQVENARTEVLKAVKDSGAKTDAQKLLVINDWLAHHNTFDMAYIMNSGKEKADQPMYSKNPEIPEHYGDVQKVFDEMYRPQIQQQFHDQVYAGVENSFRQTFYEQAIQNIMYQQMLGKAESDATDEEKNAANEQAKAYVEQNKKDIDADPDGYVRSNFGADAADQLKEQADQFIEKAKSDEGVDMGNGQTTTIEDVTQNTMATEKIIDTDNDGVNDKTANEAIELYTAQASSQMADGVINYWEGSQFGALGFGKSVCLGYSKAYTYLVQCLDTDVYLKDKDGGYDWKNWKTAEELYYDADGNIDIDAGYTVDLVRISFKSEVTMFGNTDESFTSDHYWNAVKVSNKEDGSDPQWYYVDPCYTDVYTEVMSRDRVETDGDMNHAFFLFSDTSARNLYKGNMDKTKPGEGLRTLYRNAATDQSYEKAWMSRAASNVYSDGTYMYYLYDSTDLFERASSMSGSSSGSSSSTNTKKSTEYKLVRHKITGTDGKDGDSDYETLINFTDKKNSEDKDTFVSVLNKEGKLEKNEALTKLYAQFVDEQSIYPSIGLTASLYKGKIYFNVSNDVMSYDLTTGEVTTVKEYNKVSAVRDFSKLFGGMAFTKVNDEDGATFTVKNHPIAGLTIKEDGTMVVSIATNLGFISGKSSMTDHENAGYSYEETDYNPNYTSNKTYADLMGGNQENDNDEFMWSANFVDKIEMSHLTGSSHKYVVETVPATCGRDAFTEERCEKCGLIKADTRKTQKGTAHEHHYIKFHEVYYTTSSGKKNEADNYVCPECEACITDPKKKSDLDEYMNTNSNYAARKKIWEEAQKNAAEGHVYTATDAEINDDHSQITFQNLRCDACYAQKNKLDCLLESDTNKINKDNYNFIEEHFAEKISAPVDPKKTTVSGDCQDENGASAIYIADGKTDDGARYTAKVEVAGKKGEHQYTGKVEWKEKKDADGKGTGEYEATVTDVKCTVCGNTPKEDQITVDPEKDTENSVAATCEKDGKDVWKATVTVKSEDGSKVIGSFTTDTKEVTIDKLGHKYGKPEWTWADDHKSATATFTCANDSNHVERKEAKVEEKSEGATCTKGGKVTYTATVEFNGEKYEEPYTTEVDALGHDYKVSEKDGWKWTADKEKGYTAKATFVCSRCKDSREVDATVTKEEKDGQVIYTATAKYTDESGKEFTETAEKKTKLSIYYEVHRQDYGWEVDTKDEDDLTKWKSDGAESGTVGESKRLEAIKIKLPDGVSGSIEYRTHIQDIGWEKNWAKDGEISGTSGQAKRLEAIQVKLTGNVAKNYDVYYCVHAQNFGWLGWAKNGEKAGTAGYGYRLEAIKIMLVPKGGDAPDKVGKTDTAMEARLVGYQTHVQDYGTQDYVYDGAMAGTSGQAKRMESIRIKLPSTMASEGKIEYKSHIENIGWEKSWKKTGELSGTSGKSLRLEAIQIKLSGDIAEKYDVYYRVHAENFGWLGWAKNGEKSGTEGYAYRLEALQIKLVPKGTENPELPTPASAKKEAFIKK